jgi:GDSL-like lipase/acylhydrolase family protein
MTNRKRISVLLVAAAVVAVSCSKIEPITAPALSPGRADFSVIAALGTSITAGFQSGGLVDRHQVHSYAVLFARQARARAMDLPLIDGNGLPPLLEIKHLYPPPTLIAPIAGPGGSPSNVGLPTAYHNLGIPGARVQDVIDTTKYLRNPYFSLIQRTRGSLAHQVAEQLDPPPTFLLFEFGANELLGPALNGTSVGLTSVVSFADSFGRALDTLQALLPNAKMAVVNLPDVTRLPFFTTVSNRQLDANLQPVVDANGRPKFLLGPNNVPLTATDQVLLRAQPLIASGIGYPTGTYSYLSGAPVPGQNIGLPDSMVLSTSEAFAIQDRARRFNSIIDTTATSLAKPRDYAIADLAGLLHRAETQGIELRRVLYTTKFVTGGLFSLDGVHPNDLAHALLCNQVIDAVNKRFGSNLQPLDPLEFATTSASAAGAARAGP